MNNRIVSWLLKCYPSGWRSEYGSEMEDLLARERVTFRRVCDVLGAAIRERARQAQDRFIVSFVLVFVSFFMLAIFCSSLVWRLLAAPVVEVLRGQRIYPPMLLATLPWEQPIVIWLGIPLLLTLFAAYPVSLALACRRFITSQPAKATAARSAMLYTAGFTSGLVAWQCGSFGLLMRLLQHSEGMRAVSVVECFGLLSASTLGIAVLLQVPVVLLHWRRSRAECFRHKGTNPIE